MSENRNEKLREECGVFGVYSPVRQDVAALSYYGLFALQHRGQESCGIVVNDDGIFHAHKDTGLVNDIFTHEKLSRLGEGNAAIGHVRYGTTGSTDRSNAQPLVVNHVKGHMALCHNGNLTNSYELRRNLEMKGAIFHTSSDSEVITYVITNERLSAPSIETAVERAMDRLKGAYSLIIMSPSKMLAVRDEHGFRPLCYGVREDGSYVVASESCALDTVSAKFVRDIEPGEILCFTPDGPRSIRTHCGKTAPHLCIFEYIYFARPDSVLDGVSVIDARMKAGEILAQTAPAKADAVIACPDSGIDAAIGYSHASGIPYAIGLIKNRYIGRTFIAPGQSFREDLVRIKLNPVREALNGKSIVLVDDSIVRGTTSQRIVRILRDAGAKAIHMRISSPPFLNPCYYGTDIDSREHLIACHYSVEEMAKIIGVDSLAFLPVDRVREIADPDRTYCMACFDGKYPTDKPEHGEKRQFEQPISSNPKLINKKY